MIEHAEIPIRGATLADAPRLTELIRAVGGFSALEGKSPEDLREMIARELALCLADGSHSIHIAGREGEALVGYVAVHWLPYLIMDGPEGFVSELFLVEEARGHGIGTRLLGAVEREARDRGCSRLQLINFRDRESYRRGFYEKAGWTERPDGASFVRRLNR